MVKPVTQEMELQYHNVTAKLILNMINPLIMFKLYRKEKNEKFKKNNKKQSP